MPSCTIELLRSLDKSRAGDLSAVCDSGAVEWLIASGLGPILNDHVRAHPEAVAADKRRRVWEAELSARMLSEGSFASLERILECAGERGCPVTLLKGVSIAQQVYPYRHWRPMRDIDLLVDASDQPLLERILSDLGFVQQGTQPPEFFAGHHHSMPFHHAQWRCWVEVHTALFRPDSDPGRIPGLQPAALRTHRVRVPYERAAVWRLSDSTQLVYTAVHWGAKLTIVGGLVPVIDTLLLLRQSDSRLDWKHVLEICEDPTAARYLALMLSYLERHALYSVPADVWTGLAHGRRSLGNIGTGILLTTIDTYLAEGRPLRGFTSEAMLNTRWDTLLGNGGASRKLLQLPWRMLFPPGDKGRFQPARLIRRGRSLLRRIMGGDQASR